MDVQRQNTFAIVLCSLEVPSLASSPSMGSVFVSFVNFAAHRHRLADVDIIAIIALQTSARE